PVRRLKNLDDHRNPFHLQLEETGYGESESKDKREEELRKKREQLRACFFDPTDLSAEQRSGLENILKEAFGTPRHPKFNAQFANVPAAHVKTLRLDEDTLKEGGRLYRLHCMQCHGLTGDGRGPTAQWVNPHPRDYRKGLFKFQSVDQVGKEGSAGDVVRPPSREDLYRTIYEGVESTAMQSYNMLPAHEL